MQITVSERAQLETELIQNWYDEIEKGLGEKFLEEINNSLEQICLFPMSFQKISDKGIRQTLLKRFPYHIIYYFKNDEIIILSVYHVKREEEDWNN